MSTTGPVRAALERVPARARRRGAWLTFLLVLQLWLFANGRAALGREFPTELVQFYLWFMIIPLLVELLVRDWEFLDELLKGTVAEFATKFAVGYLTTVALYLLIYTEALHAPAARIPYSFVWPMIVLQVAIVAPAEELFFRGFLPRLYDPGGKSWKLYAGVSLSDAVVSTSFSVFHFAAYGPDATFSFVNAFALSMVWLFLSRRVVGYPFHPDGSRRPLGIAFTIGSHAAFNMCAFGILTGGVVLGL